MINEAYLNAAGNYSVAGYNARLKKSFGEIYLGMDSGAEYDRQATVPNAAMGGITTPVAFALTLDIARRAVAASPSYPPDVKDLEDILNKVLADLCAHWFGLPDGDVMVTGRKSRKTLYSDALVTFEDDRGAYDQKDAEGFIRLNALRLRTLAARNR